MKTKRGWVTLVAVLILSLSTTTWASATLVHRWAFDCNALDSAGSNNGVIYGATNATGILGGALRFDGINDYVALPQLAITTQQFTISAWANQLGRGGGTDQVNQIFSQRHNSSGDNYPVISLHSEAAVEQSSLYSGAAIRSDHGSAQTLIAPWQPYNEWHHYAMTVSEEYFIFYIDGQEVDRSSNNQDGDYSSISQGVFIGKAYYSGTNRRFFNGLIDDVRIYDVALSAEQIGALATVPAPTSLILAISGLGGLALYRKR
jgi:arabinan endo-1,5-alpha-L-arabinosidase